MKKLLIGNWKLNPTDEATAKKLFSGIKTKASRLRKVKTIICPPSVYVSALAKGATSKCAVGAQDLFWEVKGAFTGQVSAPMIKRLGADYVIVGHSEMRAQGDTNETINKKIKKAFEYRLQVILCIGESERDHDGHYLEFLQNELKEGLYKIPKKLLRNLIVAYEPIWAIGAKAKAASTPQDFLEKSIFIRKVLSHIADKDTAMKIPVLYGGSVNEKNAEGFLTEGKADGLLVGRASLSKDSFNEMLGIAERVK
ncbi:triose-phosphate isomerase [bacterium]|nr:triose-phosphate isomerase [bacterium]|tara:strand:- start:11510 stop:12271 length:762 start_codon:yes stop_codon:yes gene_type:complete